MNKFKLTILFIAIFSFSSLTTLAATTQEATLIILNGNIILLKIPSTVRFDPIFVDNQNSYELFKSLPPDNYDSLLVVEDSDSEGKNFNITLAMSNLIENNNVIPFTNISLVSLSNDPSGVDTFVPTSPPASTVGVSAPLACYWTGNLEQDCATNLNNNYFSDAPHMFPTDPVNNINSTTNNIYVNDLSNYFENEIIEFDNGEKALITNVIQGTGGYLEVARGILGTTATSHAAGSGITNFGNESDQVVIIEAPEPPTGRIGAYSLGFGYKSLVEPDFKAGNYSGIITYSLYIY